jgi:hypothetical protein
MIPLYFLSKNQNIAKCEEKNCANCLDYVWEGFEEI